MGSREQPALAGPPRTSEPKFVGDSENHVQSPQAIRLRPTLGALLSPEIMLRQRSSCQEGLCRTRWG